LPSERLFGGVYARGAVSAAVGDEAWLRAMLDSEAALAQALASEGRIPEDAREAIAAVCADGLPDVAAISAASSASGMPAIPLVDWLRERVGAGVAPFVHVGATSQDIIDTAAMLVAKRALAPLLADVRGAADAAAALADGNRETAMVGRTLLQQALPTSFGLRAAGWLSGLDEAGAALARVGATRLAVQMGGPVGSRPPLVAARVAALLELTEPTLPWQAIRVRVGELAGALGVLAGVLGKIARDVTLLAADEVGEVREAHGPGRGGSSSMAHKNNPVAAVCALACTTRVPGLVATLLAAMTQEHERAAGSWQAEWGTLSELLELVGSAAAWVRESLERLEVVPQRMRENLDRLAGAGVGEASTPLRHLDGGGELIDRALAARTLR
jgi:3-carboxy-cis,cis-muconate cycloisomerase